MPTKVTKNDPVPPPPLKNIHNIGEHFDIPNVLICFRTKKKPEEPAAVKKSGDKKQKAIPVTGSKSRELRASILYVGCDCEKRNGLQDHCARSECKGSPACLTVPPTCPPSKFANGKHLQKMYEERLKRIAEAKKKKAKEVEKKKEEKKKDEKHHEGKHAATYECYPLELLKAGDACPICSKPMDKKTVTDKKHAPKVHIGPVHINMPNDCICCHSPHEAKDKGKHEHCH